VEQRSEMADQITWNSFGITARYGDLIPVPEPATVGLLILGGMILRRHRRRC
jgi:hypothetical protein